MILIAVLLAYLIGSLSSAIIVCRLMRLPDPRTQGSRNPGATNVLRIGGKTAAIITLLGDLLKGLLPVLVAKWLGLNNMTLALVSLAAFMGHLYPIFFRFEGGKGVATTIGCILALSWPTGLCWMATWLIITLSFRYVSLASMIASICAPLYIWYFTNDLFFVNTLTLMAVVLIYRHSSNIGKLLKGTENKVGN